MEKNKVLIAIPDLQLGGGAQRIAAEVGSNLNERGYDVTFFTVYEDETTYDYKGEYVTLSRKRSSLPLGFSFNILRGAKKIAKICKEKNIDTVISFMMMGNLSAVLSKVVFRNKAKIIVSVRNNPLKADKKSRWQKKMLYNKADKVVAQTKRIGKILNEEFSIRNTTVIPNMVDLQKIEKLAEKEIDEEHKYIFGEDDFIFITVGSLTEQKAQWYLLRCFKEVRRTKDDVKLVVLGDGPLKDKLKKLAYEMDIEDETFFLGRVENVFPYLKESDCFVFTSLWEGFPNVLLEALSQDLPVISTDCLTGPREILCPKIEVDEDVEYPYYGEYGVLEETFEDRIFFKTFKEESPSEDEKIFVETMMELMQNKKLRKSYLNGVNRVEDFKIDKIINNWESVI